MANRCLLLKCGMVGGRVGGRAGVGQKTFWTPEGGLRASDLELGALVPRKENHSKGAKDKRSGLRHSLKRPYHLKTNRRHPAHTPLAFSPRDVESPFLMLSS